MVNRRTVLALPLLAAPVWPIRAQPAGAPADALAAVLVACWQARGVTFSADQIVRRIGGRTGKAALLAVAGAAESVEGEGQEVAVEIAWEAGAPPSPAEPPLYRDLARGLPLLLITRDGRALLLTGAGPQGLAVPGAMLGWDAAALIGRPLIAGA